MMGKYCDICSHPIGETMMYRLPWYYKGNLKVCQKCADRDPWELVEELMEENIALSDRITELEEKLEKQEV